MIKKRESLICDLKNPRSRRYCNAKHARQTTPYLSTRRYPFILTPAGMIIHEPMTVLTNLALCLAGISGAWRVGRIPCPRGRRLWSLGLWSVSVAALVGAFFHGLGPCISPVTRQMLWSTLILASGFAGGFWIGGVIVSRVSEVRRELRLGLAFLAGGAILLAGGWDVHPNLNQNDLFHLALLPTLFFWAQAGKQFEDR